MDRIIEETAKELNHKKGTVKNVYKHIFWSVADTMKQGNFQHILLNEFGKFVVKPARKKAIDTKKERSYAIKNSSSNTNTEEIISEVDVLEE